jgi:cytochrome P450
MTIALSDGVDLLSSGAVADPYAFFGELREHDPAHWNAAHKSWVITRYEDVAAGFLDKRFSSDRIRPVFDQKLTPDQQVSRQPTYSVLSDWMVFMDPPSHTRLRNLVKRAFTPRAVQELEPRIVDVVEHVLDVPESGTVDLVADVAYHIPALVIAEMLGVPREDRSLFRGWSDDLSMLIFEGARSEEDRRRSQDGLVALSEYLHGMVREHRASPRDDLISGLIAAEEHDETLTEDEIVSTCVLLLFGGHETTTNLILNGFLALVREPDQAADWLADPSVAESAVEELNRFDGPAKMVVRRAIDSVDLHGSRICEGDRVLLVQAAANRDPRRFTDPDHLDLRREDNRNVAFGFGIHYCLGAPLARLETQIALPRMVRRFINPEVTGPIEYAPLLLTRGLTRLPVRYGP